MVFKCKICGGSLDVHIGERTAVCEYCGVEQTIPSFIDIKAQEIYNIASNYLAHNEFDKAENLYAQILIDNKSDADAYWNILMCRYGVTYVKDPSSGKYIPTCNRTLYAPIFNDENYKNAIKNADEKQRALFEANAKIIDDIQKGILSVSQKEKPFDIFISYKETDANGARTKDSIAAQDLYEKLTAEGYKVFFSRITLEDKIGTEYEPYIYAALASSKVMMTVSSSKENLESVWVKNEWSRFLSFMGKDSGKTLIPLYFDMDKSDLSDDFAHMPSYDMKTDGFEQDLIRGIKKLIPLPVMLLEKRKRRNKILKRIGLAVAACAVIGAICAVPWFMKLPDYNAAMQLYYDKNYPEATWAFADLGSYRNSDEMKEKCESSWRKSLAVVITDTYDGARFNGTYYIDNNGSLQKTNTSILSSQLTANEHGKIVSLAQHNAINVIYEDGYVSNVSNSAYNKDEWVDIIQMSRCFADTTVALRSDGTMIYGRITDRSVSASNTNDWMKPILSWKNIISFSTVMGGDGYSYDTAVIVGLTSNGSLKALVYDKNKDSGYYSSVNWSKYHDVKYLINTETGIAIINKNGTIAIGPREIEYKNAISLFDSDDKICCLNDEGNYVDTDSNMVLLKDSAYINEQYVISKNGNVYAPVYNSAKYKTHELLPNVKVSVYDEWIERMK